MTILIKGLNMPKDCPMCYLSNWNNCAEFTGCKVVQGKLYAMTKDPEYANTNTRPDWCPLVEVGRCKDCKYYAKDKWGIVKGLPVIVAHHICHRWSQEGNKVSEAGWCFLFERRNHECID